MWFGTRNGLCRFDSYEMKVYRNTIDTNSISGNWILSINEDKNGNLWVGTHQNGLNKFDPQTQKFTRYGYKNGFGNQIYQIEILSDGTLCAATNNGLAVWNAKNQSFTVFRPYNNSNSINSHLVSDLVEASDGNIYIATHHNDIQRFDRRTGKFYSIKYINRENAGNYRKRLLDTKDGNLWISANLHGVCKLNLKTGDAKFYFKGNKGLSSDVLTGDMIQNTDGKIWIATDDAGINILNPETDSVEYIRFDKEKKEGLAGDHIYALYKDDANRIWVGFFDKGVAYFDPLMKKFDNRWLSDSISSFFRSKSVISAFEDTQKNLWIGTDGNGLHCITHNGKIEHYYHQPQNQNSISTDIISSIGQDKNGNLLIGTYMGGLNVLNRKTQEVKRFAIENQNRQSLHSLSIWSILTDSKNISWLGLLANGVDIYNPDNETFTNIGPNSNEMIRVGHPNIMAIMEDSKGGIWFGSEGDGIYIYDKKARSIHRLGKNDANSILKNTIVKALYQDKENNIWIGTEGDGLLCYNPQTGTSTQFTDRDGLTGMIVLGIQQDKAGNLWVATYDGLCIFHQQSNTFSAFNTDDGLSSNELNAGTFLKLSDGKFFVGSLNGINLFDPLELTFNQSIPKVFFTQLKVLNQIVSVGDTINQRVILSNDIAFTPEITLTDSEKIFSIEFAALNITHAQKCRYRYMLQGFDDEWVTTSAAHRFASYSSLPSGSYVFKVQASNNDGKWGNNTAQLRIVVLPPFWKTVWFVSLMLLLVAAVVATGYFARLRYIREKFLQEKAINEKRIVELEKENIENELEKLTLYTVNRNRVLIDYKNRLMGLSSKAKPDVKDGLQVVIDEIDKEIGDDKEWKYIEPQLDKFYDDFISKLRQQHPALTLSEIKVATYVRMNLTSKEISEFMHKTTRAVENDRYRLRKKINLDSNESLKDYLMNL